jgi:hypothetical protein
MRDKPPRGVMPRFIWVEHRIIDLESALDRVIEINSRAAIISEIAEHEKWLIESNYKI